MGNCIGNASATASSSHRSSSHVAEIRDPLAPGHHHGATVKAHQALSAAEMGLPEGMPVRRAPVQVDPTTMHHLDVARRVNLATCAVLDTGSGCQKVDIAATGGESWARRQLGFEQAPRGNMPAQLERVIHAQGGNCPEHASLATALLLRVGQERDTAINAPVIRVWEGRNTLNTTYAMIGDPRAPQWGEHATVIVDPWPVAPAATTLAEARMLDAATGTWTPYRAADALFANTFAPGSSEWHRMAAKAEGIHPMSSHEVENRLPDTDKMRGQPAMTFGDELAAHALRVDAEELFDIRIGSRPGTAYTDGERTETFDDVWEDNVERLQQGAQALRRLEEG